MLFFFSLYLQLCNSGKYSADLVFNEIEEQQTSMKTYLLIPFILISLFFFYGFRIQKTKIEAFQGDDNNEELSAPQNSIEIGD